MLEHDRVIFHAISRDLPTLFTFCPISIPRYYHTHIKTTFPHHAEALVIVAKKQNQIIANAFRLTMLTVALLSLPKVDNKETIWQNERGWHTCGKFGGHYGGYGGFGGCSGSGMGGLMNYGTLVGLAAIFYLISFRSEEMGFLWDREIGFRGQPSCPVLE